MSKRRHQQPELPLDLPLHAPEPRKRDKAPDRKTAAELLLEELPHDEGDDSVSLQANDESTERSAERAEGPVELSLFTDEELAAVSHGAAEEGKAQEGTAQEGEFIDDLEVEDGDEDALIQDRLLGGIADLTVHLLTLGAMTLSVYWMGVPLGWGLWPAFTGLTLVFSFLYWTIPLAFWGQTPGMAWVGHVARSVTDEPLTFGQTTLRWFGAWLTVSLVGLPLLLALGGRSLSDRLSESKTLNSGSSTE